MASLVQARYLYLLLAVGLVALAWFLQGCGAIHTRGGYVAVEGYYDYGDVSVRVAVPPVVKYRRYRRYYDYDYGYYPQRRAVVHRHYYPRTVVVRERVVHRRYRKHPPVRVHGRRGYTYARAHKRRAVHRRQDVVVRRSKARRYRRGDIVRRSSARQDWSRVATQRHRSPRVRVVPNRHGRRAEVRRDDRRRRDQRIRRRRRR